MFLGGKQSNRVDYPIYTLSTLSSFFSKYRVLYHLSSLLTCFCQSFLTEMNQFKTDNRTVRVIRVEVHTTGAWPNGMNDNHWSIYLQIQQSGSRSYEHDSKSQRFHGIIHIIFTRIRAHHVRHQILGLFDSLECVDWKNIPGYVEQRSWSLLNVWRRFWMSLVDVSAKLNGKLYRFADH